MRLSHVAVLLLSCILFVQPVHPDPVPPLDDLEALTDYFFRNPLYSSFQVTPDGQTIAYRYLMKDNAGLRFHSFETGQTKNLFSRKGTDVYGYEWIDNKTVLYTVAGVDVFPKVSSISMEKFKPKVINLKGVQSLLPQSQWGDLTNFGLRLLDALPYMENKALLEHTNKYYTDLLMLDAETNTTSVVAENDGSVYRWFCDDGGTPWVVERDRKGKRGTDYARYNPVTGDMTNLPFLKDAEVNFLSLSMDGKRGLLVTNFDGDTTGICQMDLEKGEVIGKVMRKKEFDLNPMGLVRAPGTRAIVGLHAEMEMPRTIWFSKEMKNLQGIVDKALPPNRVNLIRSIDPGGQRFFIESFSDTHPGEIIVLDLEKRKLDPFLGKRPWIDDKEMSPMEFIRIPLEYGDNLFGYLTLPKGKNKDVPLIIYLIGGPGTRSFWGFDPMAQFYAAQGIAFLELQYRGCSGFGTAYRGGTYNLSFACRHIGYDTGMAAKWAVETGLADPDRIAVMGGSFGGYGTLSALTRYPELFCAGVGFAGVYDWEEEMKSDARQGKPSWYSSHYLDFITNESTVRELSPINHVEDIQAPVLLLHGDSDSVVKKRQSKLLFKAMKKAEKEVELEVLRWQGHSFGDELQRAEMHMAIASFLRKYLINTE